jgi:hypothetical protein
VWRDAICRAEALRLLRRTDVRQERGLRSHADPAEAPGDIRHRVDRTAAAMRFDGREREGKPLTKGAGRAGHGRATATRVAQHRLVGTITGGDDGARSTLCVEEAARESWGALRAHGYPAPRRQGARPGGKVPAAQRWRALALLAAPSGSAGWLRAAQRRSTPGRLWGARARVQPFVPLCAVGAWGMQVWGFVSYGKR